MTASVMDRSTLFQPIRMQVSRIIWWNAHRSRVSPYGQALGDDDEVSLEVMSVCSSAAPKCPPLGNTVHWRDQL